MTHMENKDEIENEMTEFLLEQKKNEEFTKIVRNSTIYKLKNWGEDFRKNPSKVKVKKRTFLGLFIFRIRRFLRKRRERLVESKYNNLSDFLKD